MPTKIKQRLHTLVLVAFVYQLNVCPCGHLEHNGWYLLAKSYLAPPTLASGWHDSINAWSFDSARSFDCEETELTYLVDQRVVLDLLMDSVPNGHIISAGQTDLIFKSPGNTAFQSEAPTALLALEMRAQFQVFLL